MLPSGGGRGYPQYSFVPQSNPQMATSKPNMRTTAGPPVESVSQPSLARSQAKHTRKHHQESQDGSGMDHAVLFNETIDQNTQGKPHSQRKKEINAVIADAIFHEDRQYGESYASQPARFKSTSEGINPNNPNYQNLHKQVLVEFLFWEECDQLWQGNPTYDARVFNATPGADQMGNFLAIIKSSGTTAPPNEVIHPNILMDVSELEEEEEEEGEADESQEGDWNMVSVSESVPEYHGNQSDFMLVNKQSGNHLPSQHQIKADLNRQLTGLSESSQDQCLLRATLKYEHKVTKTQAYMQEKEIAHLEKEHEREHSVGD
ncbi:hypothetical protein EDC04DRAFT_2605914 [Pisolithus marmoratus]|nr:hypothetical protein EDC04DRAFT_2605914 [Pisolithus marmoratus]